MGPRETPRKWLLLMSPIEGRLLWIVSLLAGRLRTWRLGTTKA
jgi:hypothetical protein